jgi:hypothetical protein
MNLEDQKNQVAGILENLLKSGKNYHIFIDIKRSQVTYFKYVGNKDMVKINFREYDNGRQIGPKGQETSPVRRTGTGG